MSFCIDHFGQYHSSRYFYDVNVSALKAAIIYQILIVCILWFNKEKLIQYHNILMNVQKIEVLKRKFFIKIVLSILLFIVIRILEFYVTMKW